MEIIDTHVHLNDDESFRHTIDLERAAGVVRMVVSCLAPYDGVYKPTPEQFREDNARVHEWMKCETGFVQGWAYVNPEHQQESLDEIDRAVNEYGMSGVKLECGCVCTDRRYGAIMEKAARLGVPVLQHAWFKITGCIPGESTPLDVAALAREFRNATIIMAHLGGDWQRGIKAVRDLPNVLVDTSGSIADCGMIEKAVEELGAERILFGTDLPDVDFWTNLGKIEGAAITPEQKRLILYGNAHRLLEGGTA
jgi:predicted TIM-barrel fold metal-dependent hydrolase